MKAAKATGLEPGVSDAHCHHRHGPWCCDDYYMPAAYPPQNYSMPMPAPYPPSAYGAPAPMRAPRRRDRVEDLEAYLEHLEAELARVRENLAAIKPDQEPSG